MQFLFAHHGDQHVERLFGNAVDLFHVEQGTLGHRRDQGAVHEHVGGIAINQYAGRVEVAHQTRRGEFGIAFNELETDAEFVGDGAQQRALTGARRPLEHDVAIGGQRGDHEFELAAPADDEAHRPLGHIACGRILR